MNLKFWQWPQHHKEAVIRRTLIKRLEFRQDEIEIFKEVLRHTQIGLSQNVHVTHAQRPPAPRPIRITVTWVMGDGQEYRTFIPLNGQAEWTESMPHWVSQDPGRVSHIRYSLGYNDGGML